LFQRTKNFNLKLIAALLFLATPLHAADVKISELPDAATIVGTEELPLVQSAATVRATVSELGTVLQPIDSDLTSWAGVTRASGVDTFLATPSMANLGTLLSDDAAGFITFGTTPSSANLKTLLTDETGSGGVAVFATSPVLTTPEISAFELGAGQTDTTFARTAAGEATIEGDALKHAGRQTISLAGSAVTVPVAAGIEACVPQANLDSGTNDVIFRSCDFSAGTDQAGYWMIFPPKSANESVDLTARVDWSSTTTTDGSDDVIWTFACVAFGNDDAIDGNAFPTVDTVTDTQTAASDFLSSAEITAITPAGTWAEGDALVCRITRDADAAGDNFNGTARLHNVQLYYTDNASTDE